MLGPRSLLAGSVAVLVTACRPSAPTTAPATTAATQPKGQPKPVAPAFRFDWGLPSAVAVDVVAERDGHTMKVREVLALDLDADGEHLVLRIRDVEVLEIDGRDARDPAIRRAMAPVIALLGMPIELVLTPAGEVVDSRLGDMMAALEMILGMKQQRDPQVEAKVRAMFARADVQALVKQDTSELWALWVGAWVGLGLAAGEERVVEDAVDAFGAVVPRRLRYRHEGAAAEPGHVRLTLEAALELRGPQLKAMVEGMTGESLPAAGVKELQNAHMLRVDRFDVVIDPTTLRPRRALKEETISMNGAKQRERRWTYQFDWSHDRRDAAESATLVCKPGERAEVARDDIRNEIRSNIDLVRGCYESGLAKDPSLRGRVTLQFTIAADGRVISSEIVETDVPTAVAECIRYGSRTWRFPAPRCGEVVVTYPFVLEPSDAPKTKHTPRARSPR